MSERATKLVHLSQPQKNALKSICENNKLNSRLYLVDLRAKPENLLLGPFRTIGEAHRCRLEDWTRSPESSPLLWLVDFETKSRLSLRASVVSFVVDPLTLEIEDVVVQPDVP